MLSEKPSQETMLSYGLKLAMLKRDHFALKVAQKLDFLQFYNLDILTLFVGTTILLVCLLLK